MGCYVSAGVTGAHLNPAVTLALAVHRDFPWSKVLPYSVAQVAGAFVASAVVYVTYHEALTAFDGGIRQVHGPQGTAGIWATYPQPFLSTFPGGFIDQVVGTALLVAVIFGITDNRNSPPPAGLAPVVVGLLVVLIGATFGFNSGYAINPARDFGPRLFTASPGGAAKCSAPATAGGGCRSSRRRSGPCWVAGFMTSSSDATMVHRRRRLSPLKCRGLSVSETTSACPGEHRVDAKLGQERSVPSRLAD